MQVSGWSCIEGKSGEGLKSFRDGADTGHMIRRSLHAARFEAYKNFHADLSRALHAEAQSWLGNGSAAREDYAGLAFDLSRTRTRAELAWTLRRVFGRHSPFLVDRIASALDKFRSASGVGA